MKTFYPFIVLHGGIDWYDRDFHHLSTLFGSEPGGLELFGLGRIEFPSVQLVWVGLVYIRVRRRTFANNLLRDLIKASDSCLFVHEVIDQYDRDTIKTLLQ